MYFTRFLHENKSTPRSNYVEKFISEVKAIITQDGSPSAHPMLIGRERGLPVLCGIPDLMERASLLHGKTVAVWVSLSCLAAHSLCPVSIAT